MQYLIGVLVAVLSFLFGFWLGVFEGKIYSFTEIAAWPLSMLGKFISIKRLRLIYVIIERIFMPFLATLFFLLISLIFWPKNGHEPFSPYFLLFFFPGFAIASTRVVIKRWREFKKTF